MALNSLADRFVPADVKADPENHRRARGIIIAAFSLFAWWPLFALNYAMLKAPVELPIAIFSLGLLYPLIPFILRATNSVVLPANLLSGTVFVTLAMVSYLDGGLRSQAQQTLAVVPLLAICFGARKSGLVWMVLCILDTSVMFYLQSHGHDFSRIVSEEGANNLLYFALVCTISTVSLVLAHYEKVRNELYRLASDRAVEVERQSFLILEQQQRMQTSSKMAALGEMAGGIAHEINNPLAIVRTNTEVLEEMLEQNALDPATAKRMLRVVSSTVMRIATIITGLIQFSKESDQVPLKNESVRNILQMTLSFCEQKFLAHGVQIQIDEVAENLSVDCSQVQISRVMLSLLNNALEAAEKAPEKWVKVHASDEGDKVRLSVTDSGTGIPPQIRDKMFQPFFSTKEIGKGTGLGLSVAKGLVEMHRGRLRLESGTDHTTFVVELPKHAKTLETRIPLA